LGLEEQGGNEFQLFVANEQLFVKKSNQENALQYVRIYTVSGALIEQHLTPCCMNNTIPLQQSTRVVCILLKWEVVIQ
jgi:hypothetical protein